MPFDPSEVVRISIEAGQAIMDVYESAEGIEVQPKNDDSPLTKADQPLMMSSSGAWHP